MCFTLAGRYGPRWMLLEEFVSRLAIVCGSVRYLEDTKVHRGGQPDVKYFDEAGEDTLT